MAISEEDWDSEDEEDYEEESLAPEPAKCLQCEEYLGSSRAVLDHCRVVHSLDLIRLKAQLELDYYGYIKLVNYIRSQTALGHLVTSFSSKELFDDDRYLIPVIENDAMLFDIVEQESPDDLTPTDLQKQIDSLQAEIERLKSAGRSRIESQPVDDEIRPTTSLADSIDKDYFSSYAFNDIHETMLKDRIRTDAYRDFVYDNKHLFNDKIVLDVGCGTGILSMFAARAGAKHVYSVDKSEILLKASINVQENGLQDVITCIRSRVEDLDLPVQKVDILISEWMGYGLLYEAMLDSVITARDRFLAPDGLMAPAECRILMAGCYAENLVADRVEFWNDIYGFKMNAMKDGLYDEVLIECLDSSTISTDCATIHSLELHTVSVPDLTFCAPYEIANGSSTSCLINAFVIWFDTYFTEGRSVKVDAKTRAETWKGKGNAFTTGPYCPPTHWKQVICLIKGCPIKLDAQQKLKGTLSYSKGKESAREIEIVITWSIAHDAIDTGQRSSQTYILR